MVVVLRFDCTTQSIFNSAVSCTNIVENITILTGLKRKKQIDREREREREEKNIDYVEK